ncbi:hypothetical protein [Algoriphagus sp.]|uniref:hypothetical protein n=1 Tax=Algoriphagus sp. TaxID=1872435 RepID=UPI00391A4FF8
MNCHNCLPAGGISHSFPPDSYRGYRGIPMCVGLGHACLQAGSISFGILAVPKARTVKARYAMPGFSEDDSVLSAEGTIYFSS